jgi:hypothetical protein
MAGVERLGSSGHSTGRAYHALQVDMQTRDKDNGEHNDDHSTIIASWRHTGA